MSVKIRLSRVGKKNSPMYRIVAADSRSKRDGKCIENLGTYNPLKHEIVQFNEERIQYWISQGAKETDTIKRLHKMYKEQKSSPEATKEQSQSPA